MKKQIFIIVLCLLAGAWLWGQATTIAEWNFNDITKRSKITNNATWISTPYTADDGIAANKDVAVISLAGGATFSEWVQGAGGSGTYVVS